MTERKIRTEIIGKKRTKLQKIFYYSLKTIIYVGSISFLIYLIILMSPFIFPIGGAY